MDRPLEPTAGRADAGADVERAALQRLIRDESISIVFQPIVDLRDGTILGREALTRVRETDVFPHAGALYQAAARLGRLVELESLARRLALEALGAGPADGLLFLNHSPVVMAAPGFMKKLLAELSSAGHGDPARIVLEITEQADLDDPGELERQLRPLRERGFQIAIDDVGSGISGLNRIMALRPDWVKLDRELVAHVDEEPLQQNLMRSFLHFARLSNMAFIAEGVERYEELEQIIDIGVIYGQGFYLARPGPPGRAIGAPVRRAIGDIRRSRDARTFADPSTVRVASLAAPAPTFDQATPCGTVRAALAEAPHAAWAIVLDGRRYAGVVALDDLAGRPAARPVGTLGLCHQSRIAGDVSLAEAMLQAAARPDAQMRHPLVVQESGEIVGVVTIRRLLKAAAECHRRAPSHLASLTGLPSRVQADSWLADGIRSGLAHDVAFIDLRAFDAYNVAYGFQLGDAMLLRLVGLVQALLPEGPARPFFGHLGEDRFMAAFSTPCREPLEAMVRDFAGRRGEFFSAADLEAGEFRRLDPGGHRETFPLTSVRVVYLERPMRRFGSPREIQAVARELRLADHGPRGREPLLILDRRATAAERSLAS